MYFVEWSREQSAAGIIMIIYAAYFVIIDKDLRYLKRGGGCAAHSLPDNGDGPSLEVIGSCRGESPQAFLDSRLLISGQSESLISSEGT